MIKKAIRTVFGIFLAGSFLLIPGWNSSSEAVVDRVVAIVNQEIITFSEIEKLEGALREEIGGENRLEKQEKLLALRRKILGQLVDEKLIDQEVKRSAIKIASKEIDAAVEEIKKRNGVTQEELEKALSADGLTIEGFKKQIEKRLQRMKLISYSVKVESKMGEKELREFYQRNLDRYRGIETYRPAHILFAVPKEATAEEIGKTRKKAQSVLERIRAGQDFREMALLYSEDPSSREGGDLGFFKKGELLPAIEKEALRLQVGEVSGVIRTNYGFHIIKLLDRRGGGPFPFEEVKEKVQADYYDSEMEKALKQFLTTLKQKAIIEIKL